jgi:hypothetical protein
MTTTHMNLEQRNRVTTMAGSGHGGTAKNAQDEALLLETSQALFDYLDSLKP